MKRKLSPKGLAWGGVILLAAGALVVLAVVAVRQGWLAVLLDKDALQGFVARFGVWGPLVFIALQMAQVVVSFIPGNVTTLVGGALFGVGWAFVYSYIAVVAGSMLAFGIARKLGTAAVRKLVGEKSYDRYFALIQSQGALSRTRMTLAVTLLLPFFPDDLLCLLAGLTAIPTWQFFVISLAARPWGLLFAASLGAGALAVPPWALGLIAVASVGLGVLAFRFAPVIEDRLFRLVKGKRDN